MNQHRCSDLIGLVNFAESQWWSGHRLEEFQNDGMARITRPGTVVSWYVLKRILRSELAATVFVLNVGGDYSSLLCA